MFVVEMEGRKCKSSGSMRECGWRWVGKERLHTSTEGVRESPLSTLLVEEEKYRFSNCSKQVLLSKLNTHPETELLKSIQAPFVTKAI
jgi:hypothetical protein